MQCRRSAPSPRLKDQSATWIELFFDLVFVFSVTQVVGVLHDGIDWKHLGQAFLLFWLVWWAWSQFTWALNAADTEHQIVQGGTLLATGVAFLMAVALPGAFADRAILFALPYVLVRSIALLLYMGAASADPKQRRAVQIFATLSTLGFATVLVGAVTGGTLQYVFWGITIMMDLIAGSIGARQEGWNLHPEHFAERHGLFIIIALGESLIVAAGQVTGAEWTMALMTVGLLAVTITCALWWTYFREAHSLMEEALQAAEDWERTRKSRDAGSYSHFIMVCGIIAFAVGIEEALAHPDHPLELAGRLMLGSGVLLFVGGMAIAIWRSSRQLLLPRLVIGGLSALAVIAIFDVAPWVSLGLLLVGVLLIIGFEERTGTDPTVPAEE